MDVSTVSFLKLCNSYNNVTLDKKGLVQWKKFRSRGWVGRPHYWPTPWTHAIIKRNKTKNVKNLILWCWSLLYLVKEGFCHMSILLLLCNFGNSKYLKEVFLLHTIQSRNEDNNTPLLLAAELGFNEIIRWGLLCKNGSKQFFIVIQKRFSLELFSKYLGYNLVPSIVIRDKTSVKPKELGWELVCRAFFCITTTKISGPVLHGTSQVSAGVRVWYISI